MGGATVGLRKMVPPDTTIDMMNEKSLFIQSGHSTVYIKVEVLDGQYLVHSCGYLFKLQIPSSVVRQPTVGLGLLKKPIPGHPSSCYCSPILSFQNY
ncbi:hypothetical protein TNCV_3165181 [Trichonephila clavipes]|nr:hypothetical protein TNCV_3165181 [Trichonephila clavipes]